MMNIAALTTVMATTEIQDMIFTALRLDFAKRYRFAIKIGNLNLAF